MPPNFIMKILFGICSIGLGHATRELPIIKKLLEKGHEIHIVTSGRSLIVLKKELKNSCTFYDVPDYKLPFGKKKFKTTMVPLYVPTGMRQIYKEHLFVKKTHEKEKFDRIISDNRFGIYMEDVPSYFISHQLSFIVPKIFAYIAEFLNYLLQRKFKYCVVPDFEKNSLTGAISHDLKVFPKKFVKYIGILSSAKKENITQDIDYFISISGPEPQRTIFQHKILSQLKDLDGKIVVTLGKPETQEKIYSKQGSTTVYNYLSRKDQEKMMNRAKFVICRSGYTTMMELVELGKKALLVPTPGQIEQVYLSNFHNQKKTFFSVPEKKLHLARDVAKAKSYDGFKTKEKTNESVEKFLKLIEV